MDRLWLYRAISRSPLPNYRAKIMVVAFLGTHVPLIALIAWTAAGGQASWGELLGTLAVALAATLAGTAATLFVLTHLLRPVLMTAAALRAYRRDRTAPDLPTGFTDEVGTLMADAAGTLEHLEAARVRLEHFDAATGLPNRARLALEVEARLATGEAFAVAAVAFDAYARIAASLDSDRADAAAAEVARRLGGFLGGDVMLARIAPDRFAFLVEPAAGCGPAGGWGDAVETLADLVLTASGPLRLAPVTVYPHLRAGLAAAGDGAEAEGLIDEAGAAADQAVDRARVALYSPEARAAALDRFRIEQDLRAALERDEFLLHYQPIVDLAAGRAVAAEALIRWSHPERGLVPPGLFIPVAESAGLIAPIGLWVLDRACAQIAEWQTAGVSGLRVAVNLSAEQFVDRGLVAHVRAALDRHRVDPSRLEVELTESAATSDHAHTRAVFAQLRDLGVRIAIDDFGTGFASLSQLRRLPFDKLKIDREFVSAVPERPESQAICRALMALGDGLGIDVLAEGTETDDEIRWLSQRGCRLFQGFGLARPLPAAELPALIASSRLAEIAGRCQGPRAA